MPPEEYCARVLAAICRSALEHRDEQALFVDYRELPGAARRPDPRRVRARVRRGRACADGGADRLRREEPARSSSRPTARRRSARRRPRCARRPTAGCGRSTRSCSRAELHPAAAAVRPAGRCRPTSRRSRPRTGSRTSTRATTTGDWSGVALRSVGGVARQLYPDPNPKGVLGGHRDPRALPGARRRRRRVRVREALGAPAAARARARACASTPTTTSATTTARSASTCPVLTNPDAGLRARGPRRSTMQPGESWYLDFNLRHRVANGGDDAARPPRDRLRRERLGQPDARGGRARLTGRSIDDVDRVLRRRRRTRASRRTRATARSSRSTVTRTGTPRRSASANTSPTICVPIPLRRCSGSSVRSTKTHASGGQATQSAADRAARRAGSARARSRGSAPPTRAAERGTGGRGTPRAPRRPSPATSGRVVAKSSRRNASSAAAAASPLEHQFRDGEDALRGR